jgi:regulator of protease activity HflC (stomatin/prohibitin superfamily)
VNATNWHSDEAIARIELKNLAYQALTQVEEAGLPSAAVREHLDDLHDDEEFWTTQAVSLGGVRDARRRAHVPAVEVTAEVPAEEIRVADLPGDVASAVGKASITDRSAVGRIQGSEGQRSGCASTRARSTRRCARRSARPGSRSSSRPPSRWSPSTDP